MTSPYPDKTTYPPPKPWPKPRPPREPRDPPPPPPKKERQIPAWLKEKKKPYFNPEEIWPEHPVYSDWLQSNRATYGTGMASDPLTIAAGNPYAGYLRFMEENYGWVPGPNPIQPPIDDVIDDPVADNENVIRSSANNPRVTSQTFK
jgi:hypothetical protein